MNTNWQTTSFCNECNGEMSNWVATMANCCPFCGVKPTGCSSIISREKKSV